MICTVVGSGRMGRRLGAELVLHGHTVYLVDKDDSVLLEALEIIAKDVFRELLNEYNYSSDELKAAYMRIRATSDLAWALKESDFVTEAVPEKVEIKNAVFKEICDNCAADAVLSTNTLWIPIEKIAEGCSKPDRILGLRFMHPTVLMNEVEFSKGPQTSDECVALAKAMLREMNKSLVQRKEYCLTMRQRDQQQMTSMERHEAALANDAAAAAAAAQDAPEAV